MTVTVIQSHHALPPPSPYDSDNHSVTLRTAAPSPFDSDSHSVTLRTAAPHHMTVTVIHSHYALPPPSPYDSDSHSVTIRTAAPHHMPNINCIIHRRVSPSATVIRSIHGGQCQCGHCAISAQKKAIYRPAPELSVLLHPVAEVDVPGRAPVRPCNDV